MNVARREALNILMRGEISSGRPLVSNKQSQRAVELFSRNYNCAQSVYAACATGDGLSEPQRLALGESEGEAMAADPVAGRNAIYERARQLTEAFRKAHGAILCRELTGCALDTEAGRSAFKERGLHQNICTKLVAFAAEEAVRMTADSAKK
jgi:hypothetical protein